MSSPAHFRSAGQPPGQGRAGRPRNNFAHSHVSGVQWQRRVAAGSWDYGTRTGGQRDVLFVEVDAVMVLATGVTAATVVLAVLADTAVAVGHVAPQFAALLLGLDHLQRAAHKDGAARG